MNRIARRSPGPITLAWAIVVVGYATGVSSAQPASLAELQQWIDGQRRVVERLGHTDPVFFRWTTTVVPPNAPIDARLTERQLERLPDHPLRGRLEEARRQAEHGWATGRTLLAGGGRWRVAMEDHRAGWRNDFGLDRNDTWMWHESQVNIANVDNAPPGYDYASMVGEYWYDLALLLTGGLYIPTPHERAWTARWNPDGTWTATSTFAFGTGSRRGTATGSWMDGRGHVDRIDITAEDSGPVITIASERWSVTDDGLSIAGVVDVVVNDRLDRRVSFINHRASTSDEVRTAARVPRAGIADPLRDTSVIRSVEDRRGGRHTTTVVSPDGTANAPIEVLAEDSSRSHLRLAGWMAGAALLSGLLFAWWRWKHRS